jgi:hypothetical protein
MEIQIKGRVLEVNSKDGISYVTMNDTQEGGSFKVSIPGGEKIQVDSLVNLAATCKPGMGKFGLYLKVTKIHSEQKGG